MLLGLRPGFLRAGLLYRAAMEGATFSLLAGGPAQTLMMLGDHLSVWLALQLHRGYRQHLGLVNLQQSLRLQFSMRCMPDSLLTSFGLDKSDACTQPDTLDPCLKEHCTR